MLWFSKKEKTAEKIEGNDAPTDKHLTQYSAFYCNKNEPERQLIRIRQLGDRYAFKSGKSKGNDWLFLILDPGGKIRGSEVLTWERYEDVPGLTDAKAESPDAGSIGATSAASEASPAGAAPSRRGQGRAGGRQGHHRQALGALPAAPAH